MDSQGTAAQAAAALLRRPAYTGVQGKRARHEGEGKETDHKDHKKRGRDAALTAPHQLPVLETDEFRVVEPDGTEDPWASADDGIVPDRPADDGNDQGHAGRQGDQG
ncbi:MAG: hypothetical protein GAK35_00105 [Herbaspirillum frisingense]|uniref:Uncharacterized protein n=1 Tax=Herbaspirillum frisingense TaxID=92645 RepID=A0A7V8G0R3_9BURK|nr:MAG: hypothetical protein GAK35_00105 [Herbaspirillum frisingense]